MNGVNINKYYPLLEWVDLSESKNKLEDLKLVSDFFALERCNTIKSQTSSSFTFNHKVFPIIIALIAVAYQRYEEPVISIAGEVSKIVIHSLAPFVALALSSLWNNGDTFRNEELRLSNGNATFGDDWSIVINQTPELNFTEFLNSKNLSEEEKQSKMVLFKSFNPSNDNLKKRYFSHLNKSVNNIDSHLKYLFKITFAQNTCLGHTLPLDIWNIVVNYGHLIKTSSDQSLPY